MHGSVLNVVDTDALVLRHQTISIHGADEIFIVLGQFRAKNITYLVETYRK